VNRAVDISENTADDCKRCRATDASEKADEHGSLKVLCLSNRNLHDAKDKIAREQRESATECFRERAPYGWAKSKSLLMC
jgi:hypothetical protein